MRPLAHLHHLSVHYSSCIIHLSIHPSSTHPLHLSIMCHPSLIHPSIHLPSIIHPSSTPPFSYPYIHPLFLQHHLSIHLLILHTSNQPFHPSILLPLIPLSSITPSSHRPTINLSIPFIYYPSIYCSIYQTIHSSDLLFFRHPSIYL